MFDFIRRLLIAVIMGLCVSLLFLGTKHTEAGMIEIKEQVPQNGDYQNFFSKLIFTSIIK